MARRSTGTRYHRLARETPAYGWWKLPVAALVILAAYLGLTILIIAGAAVWFAVSDSGTSLDDWFDAVGDLDLRHLDFFVLDMLSLVVLIPAVLLGVLAVGPRPVGYLSSVAGHLRWRWLGLAALIASGVSIATIGGSLIVSEIVAPDDVSAPVGIDSHVVWAILLVLLIVPFQSAAEEYLFRGYLMQLVGSWSRFAILPILVTTPLFVAGHAYELWGLVDVGLFGLTAAILTIRTGGLEAGIAAHAANNVVLFVLDALGMVETDGGSSYGPIDVLPTVISSVLLLVIVEWAARRTGIRTTRDPIPLPPPPQAPMWPPPPYAMVWYAPPQAYAPPPGYSLPPQHAPAPPVVQPSPSLSPGTPEYPGELPEGWNQRP